MKDIMNAIEKYNKVTLELDCKDFRIRQLYGKKDVKAPAEVFAFVKKYIKEIKKIIKDKQKKENAA